MSTTTTHPHARDYETTFTAIADALVERTPPAIARATASTMVYSVRKHRREQMLRLVSAYGK